MMDSNSQDSEYPQFVEVDPTGRYGRYNEILGKGGSKTVYRAFDEYEGIEVAWNQVKLNDFLQCSEDLERLYCEIHLLKTLKHKNIMKLYSSWVDISKRKINFVTEMFTSGTLRQYRQKHRRVNIRALKHWCRQILSGLLYLHSHDPPIIHRDLKCDNIFVNGNQGEVKIGDLGLAAILRKPLADHCVGTPEFMAPEVYEEAYNELVDIYSFGMCVLEMVTFEYPYSECTHPAQIYKKVISGRKPDALYKVKDPEVRQFVEKCLATVSERFSARELLNDPFVQIDEPCLTYREGDITAMGHILRQSSYSRPLHGEDTLIDSRSSFDDLPYDMMLENGWEWNAIESETHGFDTFHSPGGESCANLEIAIRGMRRDDGSIFLRIRISDAEGNVRNIHFPFDIENDTASGVVAEMVTELNITDYDVTQIAEMIDAEVSSLVPEWQPGMDIGEIPSYVMSSSSREHELDVSSAHSVLSYLSIMNESCAENLNATSCSHLDRALHGRFGEITYHVKESEHDTPGTPTPSSVQSDALFPTNSDEKNRYIDQSLKSHHKAPCLEKFQKETDERNKVRALSTSSSSSVHKPLQASALKSMKSFHFGTNFSYHIPSNDTLQGDASNVNINKKSTKNDNIAPEHIFGEMNLYSGIHNPSNVLGSKAFPMDAVDVRNA